MLADYILFVLKKRHALGAPWQLYFDVIPVLNSHAIMKKHSPFHTVQYKGGNINNGDSLEIIYLVLRCLSSTVQTSEFYFFALKTIVCNLVAQWRH